MLSKVLSYLRPAWISIRRYAHIALRYLASLLPAGVASALLPSPMIQLRCVGFCGADDTVAPSRLKEISDKHPWVEWGVLFRDEKAGLPRYASEKWLAELGKVNSARQMRLAGHLCATHVDELLRGDTSFVSKLHHEVGFQRVQVNATAANGADISMFATEAGSQRCVEALRKAMVALPRVEFIMQRNEQTRPIWAPMLALESLPPNVSFLFDESMGLGVSCGAWAAPPPSHVTFGYAGGLNPGNISK